MAVRHNILIIGPSWVGDMVMAQSLFIALKQQHPACKINVLTPQQTSPLLARMPEVRRTIAMPVTHKVISWQQHRQIGRTLRSQYNQTFILPNSQKSTLIPFFAKIPVRTGWHGKIRYGLLNDIRVLDKSRLPLMMQRFVTLAFPATQSHQPPTYSEPSLHAEAPNTALLPTKTATQPRMILCPSAEFGPAKQWPVTHYATLAESLIQQGWQVLIMGSKADAKTAQSIIKKLPNAQQCFNLYDKTQLNKAINIIATADHVVTNDSSLIHIATTLQKPLTALYRPTSPSFTPPLSSQANILQISVNCGPCFQRACPEKHHKYLQDIRPKQVLTHLQQTTH